MIIKYVWQDRYIYIVMMILAINNLFFVENKETKTMINFVLLILLGYCLIGIIVYLINWFNYIRNPQSHIEMIDELRKQGEEIKKNIKKR